MNGRRSARLVRLIAVAASAVVVVSGFTACRGIDIPTPVERPVPVQEPRPDPVVNGAVPRWYGTDFTSQDCPIPRDDGGVEFASDAELLDGAATDAGWCVYKSTTATTYYVIPPTADASFGAQVRSVLEPIGWGFESTSDTSPQWSWLTSYPPEAAELGFADGAVHGTILSIDQLDIDDLGTYRVWFLSLEESFAPWDVGDSVYILGIW